MEALRGSTELDRRCLGSSWNDAYKLAVLWTFHFEHNLTVCFRKQRVVFAQANIGACMETGSALTNDNAACRNCFAAVALNTKSFRLGIATVTGTTCCFFVSHDKPPNLRVFFEGLALNTRDLDFSKPLTVALTLH